MRIRHPKKKFLQTAVTVTASFILVLFLGGLSTRSTRAEFEVPIINTNNFTAADFRAIYGFYRAQGPGYNENYEAWAVGVTAGTTFPYGAIYRFRGATSATTPPHWEQMIPYASGDATQRLLPGFTAIGGQASGGYSEVLLAGVYPSDAALQSSIRNTSTILSTVASGGYFYGGLSETGSLDLAKKLAYPSAITPLVASCNEAGYCTGGSRGPGTGGPGVGANAGAWKCASDFECPVGPSTVGSCTGPGGNKKCTTGVLVPSATTTVAGACNLASHKCNKGIVRTGSPVGTCNTGTHNCTAGGLRPGATQCDANSDCLLCNADAYCAQCTADRECIVMPEVSSTQIYAVGARDGFHRPALAGGEDKTLYTHTFLTSSCTSANLCATNWAQSCRYNDKDASTALLLLPSQVCPADYWKAIPTAAANLPAGIASTDDITSVTYVTDNMAYVTTTGFGALVRPYNLGSCSNQTGKLWRVMGDPTVSGNWQQLAQKVNTCFYSVTVQPVNASSPNNGPLNNYIWIAAGGPSAPTTGRAIYRALDNCYGGGCAQLTLTRVCGSGSGGAPCDNDVMSVSSYRVASGSGTKLLWNGNFESWSTMSANTAVPALDSNINPDFWSVTGENGNQYRDTRLTGGANSCAGTQYDVRIVDLNPSGGHDYAVQVEPGQAYLTSNCAPSAQIPSPQVDYLGGSALPANRLDYARSVTTVSQNVPYSAVEGRKFHITGKYKVEFPLGAQTPPDAFGGVQFGCPNNGANAPTANTTCSTATNSYVRTYSQGATSGFQNIDFTLSVENGALSQFGAGYTGYPNAVGQALTMEVRCLASFGSRVTCNDLQVSEIDTPDYLNLDQVTVVGVGRESAASGTGLVVSNPDAINNTTGFSAETSPSNVPNTGVTALDPLHVYVAGKSPTVGNSISVLERTPGNVTHPIWIGTTSPGDNPGGDAAVGWLSTNCSDTTISGAGSQTVCEKVPETYGLTLDKNLLTGRAWLGKQIASGNPNDDRETIELGACVGEARRPNGLPGGNLTTPDDYSTGGRCLVKNTIGTPCVPGSPAGTCACLGTATACNTSRDCANLCNYDYYGDPANYPVHTCWGDKNRTCFSDTDCIGRCEKDTGFACMFDADCQAQPQTSFERTGSFTSFPWLRLQCDRNSSSSDSSSQIACSGGSWLTFNPAEFTSSVFGNSFPAGLAADPGGRNNCPNGGACLDATNGWKLSGIGQFTTLANPADPSNGISPATKSDASDNSWVSLRGAPNGAPNGTLLACQGCTVNGSNYTCNFCQDERGQSCTPGTAPAAPAYPWICNRGYCGGDLSHPPCLDDSQCQGGIL